MSILEYIATVVLMALFSKQILDSYTFIAWMGALLGSAYLFYLFVPGLSSIVFMLMLTIPILLWITRRWKQYFIYLLGFWGIKILWFFLNVSTIVSILPIPLFTNALKHHLSSDTALEIPSDAKIHLEYYPGTLFWSGIAGRIDLRPDQLELFLRNNKLSRVAPQPNTLGFESRFCSSMPTYTWWEIQPGHSPRLTRGDPSTLITWTSQSRFPLEQIYLKTSSTQTSIYICGTSS